MKHCASECFATFNVWPLPFTEGNQLVARSLFHLAKGIILQNPTSINQYVTPVLEDVLGIISSLDLHHPLLGIFLPPGANNLMAEANVLEEIVFNSKFLEITEDFGGTGVATTAISISNFLPYA